MNTAQGFPNISVPPIGPDGRWNQVWYQFLVSLFNRTGGTVGSSTVAIQTAVAALQAEVSSDERLIAFEDGGSRSLAFDPLLAELLADPGAPRASDSLSAELLWDTQIIGRRDFDQATLRALTLANDASDVPVARANLLGISRPDGATVTISSAGVLSATGSGGTVTSVAVSVPAEFSVAGSPVTSSGTIAISKATQAANLVWAGPSSGAAAVPGFRSIATADIASALTAPGPIGSATPGTGAFTKLGIGTLTSPWSGTTSAIDVGAYLGLWSYSGGGGHLAANSYWNGSAWIAKTTGAASYYSQVGGVHNWTTAPSVAAGGTLTMAGAMALDASGNLLVGYATSNGSYKLQVNSQIFATSATIATSDQQFKKNVTPISTALSLINALNPVEFDFIPDAVYDFPTGRQIGFIAQDVQAALSGTDYGNSLVFSNTREAIAAEAAVVDDEGNIVSPAIEARPGLTFLGLADAGFTPLVIKSIQELVAQISALQGTVTSQAAAIAALQAKAGP